MSEREKAKLVFDAMRGAVDQAFREGRELRRWEVNEAAAMALCNDQRLAFPSIGDIRGKPLLGAPIDLFIDRSDDPKWYLIVEVGDRGFQRFGEWPA